MKMLRKLRKLRMSNCTAVNHTHIMQCNRCVPGILTASL